MRYSDNQEKKQADKNIAENKDKMKQINDENKNNTDVQEGQIENIKAEKEDKDMNGNMVNNLDDMKKLGKEMEDMRTGKELKKEGQVADPVQHSSKPEKKDEK
ncbi:hypothetical protein [Bacillus horti]|uniref:Uncharacterized protein n=1 Tax=Caldalkalibacillus horti TaxID=77523 RepID=A0ABT9W4T0_9BACI|nr:hypothetical protein [Bacillus horti]MDQ0168241.1 hypothetical protein [Bacillus horti]